MSLYSTPGTSALAEDYFRQRKADMLDDGSYRELGGGFRTSETTNRRLRVAAIVALVCAPFSFLIAPLVAALVLGHYTVANTSRDGASYEDRTRGTAVVALITAYTVSVVMLGGLLLAVLS